MIVIDRCAIARADNCSSEIKISDTAVAIVTSSCTRKQAPCQRRRPIHFWYVIRLRWGASGGFEEEEGN